MTTRGLVVLGAIAMVMATTLATPAHAQDREATSAALQKFDEGRRAFEAGQFEMALLAFEASHSLLASPNSLLYMARCYRALGRVASAHVNFQLSARQAEERLRATNETRYGATRDAAKEEGAAIASKVPHLTLVLPAERPAELVVKQNGRPVPTASFGAPVETDPGVITIEATGHRMRPFATSITLKDGEDQRVAIVTERLPTAVVVPRFSSRPAGMALELDGASIDPREWDAPRELDVGAHRLVARAPGHRPFVWSQALTDRERVEVPIALEVEEPKTNHATPKWLFFAAAGTSVATLGTATILAARAQAMSDEEQAKDPLLRDPERRNRIATHSTVANVLFVSGALLGMGAGVLAFTTQWGPTVGANAGPDTVGVVVRGSLR